jgi:Ribosome recycling factor
VAIRNIRRDAMDAFKKQQKNSEITEDELKDSEEEVQKLTDKYIDKIDKMAEAKTKEIMTV